MDKISAASMDDRLDGCRVPDPQGLVLALELMELGIELTKQRIVRECPNISRAELIVKTNEWLRAPRSKVGSAM